MQQGMPDENIEITQHVCLLPKTKGNYSLFWSSHCGLSLKKTTAVASRELPLKKVVLSRETAGSAAAGKNAETPLKSQQLVSENQWTCTVLCFSSSSPFMPKNPHAGLGETTYVHTTKKVLAKYVTTG